MSKSFWCTPFVYEMNIISSGTGGALLTSAPAGVIAELWSDSIISAGADRDILQIDILRNWQYLLVVVTCGLAANSRD